MLGVLRFIRFECFNIRHQLLDIGISLPIAHLHLDDKMFQPVKVFAHGNAPLREVYKTNTGAAFATCLRHVLPLPLCG